MPIDCDLRSTLSKPTSFSKAVKASGEANWSIDSGR